MAIDTDNIRRLKAIIEAVDAGPVAMMECTLKSSGETVDALCAVDHEENGGGVMLRALCVFPRGSMQDFLNPPPEAAAANALNRMKPAGSA